MNWMGNVSHSLRHLHTWSPVGGAIWGGLGNAALQEEACHCGYSLGLKPFLLPVCSFCFVLVAKDGSSHLCVPVTMPTACCCASHRGRFYPSGTAGPGKPFCKLLSSWCFNTAAEKWLIRYTPTTFHCCMIGELRVLMADLGCQLDDMWNELEPKQLSTPVRSLFS